MIDSLETIVGLEIHVELSTKTKMFCRCSVPTLQNKPNTLTCPVCLGLPGALPYTNREAIESCIKIGLALNCQINTDSFFERKNYFYPDLAKGFQTSQYLFPFAEKGFLEIEVPVILGSKATPESKDPGQARMTKVKRRIGITRVHMEEDTGKLNHSNVDGKEVSLIDFNRSGVPLVEIVTEPDIRSGEEAKIFLTELQKTIRYLGVSDADMEKGHMRLEPNISLRKIGMTTLPKYKVEVKNINSFRFVEKAIQFEEIRHAELLQKGETPVQETRGWNEFKNKTVSQRSKEEAHDYRYFPEPDIPPIHLEDKEIEEIQKQIPELPIQKAKRLVSDLGLSEYNAEIITRDKDLSDFFEEAEKIGNEHGVKAKEIANQIINKKVAPKSVEPASLIKTIISSKQTSQLDDAELEKAIENVLKENPKAVEDFKNGKEQIIGFLIGQTKKLLALNKANVPEANDTNQIRNKLLQMLK